MRYFDDHDPNRYGRRQPAAAALLITALAVLVIALIAGEAAATPDVCPGTHLAPGATHDGAWGTITSGDDGVAYDLEAGWTATICVKAGSAQSGGGTNTVTVAGKGTVAAPGGHDLSHWSVTVTPPTTTTTTQPEPEPAWAVVAECRDVAGTSRYFVGLENTGPVAFEARLEIDTWGDAQATLQPGEELAHWQVAGGGPTTWAAYVNGDLVHSGPYDPSQCTPTTTTTTPPDTTTTTTTPTTTSTTTPPSSTTTTTPPTTATTAPPATTSTTVPATTPTVPTTPPPPDELPRTGVGAGALGIAGTLLAALGGLALRAGRDD